jgi:asparagine synthase (glutamine-hydrolysing)
LETRHFLADHNLNYADKMGMATGVEIRVPFLDPELVDLACRVPPELKVHRGVTKWALKKAMEGVLPHDVIYRPKAGFGVPLRRWFVEGSMPAIVADALSRETVTRRGLFDANGIERLLKRTVAGSADGAYLLMSMATIELWCRLFVDPTVPVAPAQPWLVAR